MNKKILAVVCLGLLVMVGDVFAAGVVRCTGLVGTRWKDVSDKVFGQVKLSFDYMSGNPNSNGALIHYTLEYTMNGNDHFVSGATGINTQCTTQPDGTAYIKMGFEDSLSYLVLQGNDENTFKVMSGSQLANGSSNTTSVAGPFIRT